MDFRSSVAVLAAFLMILSASVTAWGARARDPRLAELAATLAHLPENPAEDDPTRGTRPELTTAKHQLRDWIGIQLRVGNFADPTRSSAKSIAARLGKKMKVEGISAFNLNAWRSGPMLVVETSFGILCGEDDSLYGWYWNGRSWEPSFAYERNDYTGKYSPLSLDTVKLTADGASPAAGYYVLASSVGSWCTSNWLGRMYQLFHIDGTTGRATLIADEDLFAFVTEGDRQTELTADHAVIKYTSDTVDGRKKPMRDSLVMYRLSNGHASRVRMAAADAEDYVEKWLAAPQLAENLSQLAAWRQTLRAYMAKRDSSSAGWSSMGPAARCRDDAKLWQFPVVFERTPIPEAYGRHTGVAANAPTESHTLYFLIHEDGHYSFSMQGLRSAPRRHCPVLEEQ